MKTPIILSLLAIVALASAVRAVNPPPDGGYPGGNTAEGTDALFSLDVNTAMDNTAVGWEAMIAATTGDSNSAFGAQALLNNSGDFSTGIGAIALAENAADYNTAIGYRALCLDRQGPPVHVTGGDNTASGAFALASNTSGIDNTASGFKALYGNTDGSFNTADGSAALATNTTGIWNTATGWGALNQNTVGSYNMAGGLQALVSNTTGNENTALGLNALFSNTTGSRNTALGAGAGGALTTGSDNIVIGNSGVAGDSGKIRIGITGVHNNTYVAGIYGAARSRASVPVYVDSTGHLGTSTSSVRFKEAIRPMDEVSEAILALKPVTFCYKKELDPEASPQFGLVAEEVAKVNPDLVVFDEESKPYTVRYEAVNAMLLNEFIKEHRKVATLERQIAQQQSINSDQQKMIQNLTTRMNEQAAHIQKVSAQLQLSGLTPRIVVNDPKTMKGDQQ